MKISTELLLTFFHLPRIGRKTAKTVLKDCPFDILNEADLQKLIQMMRQKFIFTELDVTKAFSKAESILKESEQADINIYSLYDDDYPPILKQIDDPPLFINIKGDIGVMNNKTGAAIVGTREPTEYGSKVARRLGKVFAEKGFNVVSGLAHGCDTYAHEGCVYDAKGTAIAVMAHGLNTVYPKANTQLSEDILSSGGLLVSEYFIGTKSRRNYFVERDRIQAALSKAVVVIETTIKGGTMHTARFCTEYGRILACIAHPADMHNEPSVIGNQQLIGNGSMPLRDKSDVEELIKKITQ